MHTRCVAYLCIALLAIRAHAPAAAQVPAASKDALLRLQAGWQAETTTERVVSASAALNWQPDTDPCEDEWLGVLCACYAANGRMTIQPCASGTVPDVNALALTGALLGPGHRIRGTLSEDISTLARLHRLELTDQLLSGTLPAALFTHTKLSIVKLAGNYFYGPIVPDSVQTVRLSVLDVQFNMLSGALPARLCTVDHVLVDGNALLCGPVPSCLAAGGTVESAYDTGLHVVGADPHDCADPVPQCTRPPEPASTFLQPAEPENAGKFCTISSSAPVLGNLPVTLRLSTLAEVNALVLRITDHALVNHEAWIWMDKEAEAVASFPAVRRMLRSQQC